MYGADCRGLQYMFIHCMGWLRLVGSLKLQVSFAEYYLFYRALLQKKPVILRSLLIQPPTIHVCKLYKKCAFTIGICNLYFEIWWWIARISELLGSLKSQVSFAKEPYKRDNILIFGNHQHSLYMIHLGAHVYELMYVNFLNCFGEILHTWSTINATHICWAC